MVSVVGHSDSYFYRTLLCVHISVHITFLLVDTVTIACDLEVHYCMLVLRFWSVCYNYYLAFNYVPYLLSEA